MADDTVLVPVQTRSDRLAARKRKHRIRVAIISLTVVVAACAAVAAAFTYNENGSKPASAAAPSTPKTGVIAQKSIGHVKALKAKKPPRPLTHAAPLRLWVGGDSLAGEIGPALGNLAGGTGLVHTQVDYKVSSGLASNDIRDWQARATDAMAQYNPEAVVFEIGTNDASIVSDTKNAEGVPAWEPGYRMKVAQMMDTLVGDPKHPRTVFWVGAPTMELDWRNHGVQELNRVMREEAQKRASNVIYVDAYSLFALNGQYSRTIRTLGGDIETVRISDGVHLSDAGAKYLGGVLFALLDVRWNILKHADPSQPINWDESVGSSGNGGSSYSPSCCASSYSNGSSSNHSGSQTPDTPAPPPSLETTAPSYTPGTTSAFAPGTSAATTPATSPATTPGTTAAKQPPGGGAP